MSISLVIEEIDSRMFISGISSSGTGPICPIKFYEDTYEFYDNYGNYKYELLPDNSIVLAGIVPTQAQIDEYDEKTRVEKAQEKLLRIIVRAIKNTAGPAASWSQIDAELRSLLP